MLFGTFFEENSVLLLLYVDGEYGENYNSYVPVEPGLF